MVSDRARPYTWAHALQTPASSPSRLHHPVKYVIVASPPSTAAVLPVPPRVCSVVPRPSPWATTKPSSIVLHNIYCYFASSTPLCRLWFYPSPHHSTPYRKMNIGLIKSYIGTRYTVQTMQRLYLPVCVCLVAAQPINTRSN